MLKLSADPTFHYELLRILGSSHDRGADIGEVLGVAAKIAPGSFESWYEEFKRLADHVRSTVDRRSDAHRVSVRNAMFRAASYYRAADFFLHGNPHDPRMDEVWRDATLCFDRAISLLDVPGERLEIDTGDFRIPAILYRADAGYQPRATLLLCNGFDGSQEEMLHAIGFAALERGFNVLTFEGPGQPTVRREQGLGFIPEWERVVTPVVTVCRELPCVDPSRIALLGYSFGGYLAPRAAAFERRLAALVCVDGLFDVGQAFAGAASLSFQQLFDEGRVKDFNHAVLVGMMHSTNLRWAIEHGCWAFRAATPYEFLRRAQAMTLRGIAKQVECPVLVCEAEDDRFFSGQPAALLDALGDRATYRKLTGADAAGEHCHVGASDVLGRVVMDWLEEILPAVSSTKDQFADSAWNSGRSLIVH
jgi:alpha-beta hydrolase superfamily lysophospholipase